METEDVPGNNISMLFLAMFLVLFFITFVLSNAFDGQLVRCKENGMHENRSCIHIHTYTKFILMQKKLTQYQ